MTELFQAEKEQSVELPSSGSALRKAAEQPWQETGSAGFRIKPLMHDATRGLRTWLMEVSPGAYAPLHDHEEIEQIYVLQGSFYDQDNTYGAGDYVVRAPGAAHTAGSEEGAMVLLFYSAP